MVRPIVRPAACLFFPNSCFFLQGNESENRSETGLVTYHGTGFVFYVGNTTTYSLNQNAES